MDQPFIRRVILRKHKSIAACRVDLGQMMFLVGPNGAGKSNFLDALRFVADSGPAGLQSAENPPPPNRLRNAKGWLAERIHGGYDPIIHQLRFTRTFDPAQARRNPSFNRFYCRVQGLLQAT